MKTLLRDLFKRGKALFKEIKYTMFDSNNPETAVEQLLKPTEKAPNTFEKEKDSEVHTPLSDAPNLDYYEESKDVKKEKKAREQGEKTEYIRKQGICEDSVVNSDLDVTSDKQLMSELPNLLEELNRLCTQTTDKNVISTINFCENRIVEMMLSCGCESIDKDLIFDNSRHVPQPFSFVQNGCSIERIIKPGLSYKNKILIKAIVKCKL